jgi:hypothetical protein
MGGAMAQNEGFVLLQVLPEAVTKRTDFLPEIYGLASNVEAKERRV